MAFRVFSRFQGYSRGIRGLGGVSVVFNEFQKRSRSFQGLQERSRAFQGRSWGFQKISGMFGVPQGFWGVSGVFKGLRSVRIKKKLTIMHIYVLHSTEIGCVSLIKVLGVIHDSVLYFKQYVKLPCQ